MSYSELATIAEEEFFDVVLHSQIMAGKLRLHIVDGCYLRDENLKIRDSLEVSKYILFTAFLSLQEVLVPLL